MADISISLPSREFQEWNVLATSLPQNFQSVSKRKTDLIVGRVLHALRNSLTFGESGELIARLPDYFKFIFICDWRMKGNPVPIRHLDQLIMRIRSDDEQKENQVFTNELDILKAVIVIFRIMDKHVQWMSMEFLDMRFRQEIKKAMEL